MTVFLVTLLVACFQTSAVGLQKDLRERAVPMDENPITITVTQGSTAVLPCSVDPRFTEQNKDQYKVVWVSPERTAISIEDRRMINDMRISVERPFLRDWNLHIRNVSITDTGEYMCQLNTDPVKSKSIHLLVNVPPTIVEFTQPVELTRMEGDEIELYCNATGIPTPSVTWYRMNRWTAATREKVGKSGEQLVIYNVTRMCADVYTCVAENGVPPATSQEFIVTVNYRPEIKLHNVRIGQEVGKETILECIISASPQHMSLWRRDKHVFGNSHKSKYEVNVYDDNTEPNTIVLSLRILRVELSDYGPYVCEADNNFGRTFRQMELYEVRPKLPSTTTTTTTTTSTTSTTVTSKVRVHGKGGFSSHDNSNHHRFSDKDQGSGRAGPFQSGYPEVVVGGRNGGEADGVYGAGDGNGSGSYVEGGGGDRGAAPSGARPSVQLGSGSARSYGVSDNDNDAYSNSQGQRLSASHCRLLVVCAAASSLWWVFRRVM